MKCLTMDKFVLEIPNFIPYDICESIVNRFENDNRKVEGSFTYPVNDQMITRKKNNFELSSTTLGGWEDVNTLFLDYTGKVYEAYGNHLKNTFNHYGDPQYPVYDRELFQIKLFVRIPIQD